MSLSAYRIGQKVWIVHTERVAEPLGVRDLPLGSIPLTPDEAAEFAEQILAAAIRPIVSLPKR